MDDLIDADFGKHDYDWLLSPPETPLVPSRGEKDQQITPIASRGRSTRSASTARASRASASQSCNVPSTKPLRSSSVTHPSVLNNGSSISINRSASTLNTSISSVASRSSIPVSRSTTSRPSLTSRPVPARFQTPAKTKPASTSPAVETTKSHTKPASTSPALKTTKSHNSRPQILSNSNPKSNPTATSSSPRLHSRSSIPTRNPVNQLPTPIVGRTTSVGKARNSLAAAAQPRSPSSRALASVHPVDILDFPNASPPNPRSKLPERVASVGRVHPGAAKTEHSNLNSQNAVSPSSKLRRALPAVSHSKFSDNLPKAQLKSYGQNAAPSQTKKSVVANGAARRINKAVGAAESTGFGRNISKMSLDMALRHMDIKQSIGGIKGTSLIAHGIRSNSRPKHISDPAVPVNTNDVVTANGRAIPSPDCNRSSSDFSPQENPLTSSENNTDPHGSSHDDAMLLNEDSCNFNWLHDIEDNSGQQPLELDHGFEPMLEPFGPL